MEFGLLYDWHDVAKQKYKSLVAKLKEIFDMPEAMVGFSMKDYL